MKTDILIIGSGPVGATYARLIHEAKPHLSITMVDAGPQISDIAGQHTKNFENQLDIETAQIKSQGPKQSAYPPISVHQRAEAVQKGQLTAEILARAGTHLITPDPTDLLNNQMPAAAASTNIGGMGAHWTCACPTPGNLERIPCIPNLEMEDALAKARKILHVTQEAFPITAEGQTILDTLGGIFDEKLSKERKVQAMPLACKTDENHNRYWTGPDLILGDLSKKNNSKIFQILSDTICKKLIDSDGHISKAILENRKTNETIEITAQIVIVAADPLRTPQLLWASDIRPAALGRYLNEHPFIFTFVELNLELVEATRIKHTEILTQYDSDSRREPTIGVFWIPFDAPHHPFHGQIMHMDLSPLKTTVDNSAHNPKHIVGLGYGCLKESSFDDHIVFSDTEKDFLGMPKMTFKYQYSAQDIKAMNEAKSMQSKAALAFGKIIKDGDQTIMPAGTSMHYEGTYRMGEADNGESVCDSYSKVWGYKNLYLGGSGLISVSTTSNPTLTAVALAIRSCEKILQDINN